MNDINSYLQHPQYLQSTGTYQNVLADLRPAPATETARISPSVRRVGRLTLTVSRGPDAGKCIEFVAQPGAAPLALRGGRSQVGDIVLDDPQVSGAHFDLELRDSSLLLRDLDSASGVFVAGVRVREAYLSAGDSFVVGDSELKLVSTETIDVALAMTDHFGELYGRSPAMRNLFCDLASLTERGDRLGVLIHGEPGTGKEMVARELHTASMRGRQPFIVFNAANTEPELAASLLFGQARGALPNAVTDERGCLEAANGGTLYLKDVDALSPALQLQLHRALQEGGVTRLGEQSSRPIDVRLICSTRCDLRGRVAVGEFRPELYFRIAGATLALPPLHAREADAELLAEHFLHRLSVAEKNTRRLSKDALAALRAHHWPNHVAGLRDAVERGFFASDAESISRADLNLGKGVEHGMLRRLACFETLFGIDHSEAVARFEKLYFQHLLCTHPSKAKAARTSGMTNEGFRLALRRLKITKPASRPPALNMVR